MEKDKKAGSCSEGKGVKMERKVIEKNRRDQLKALHSQLHSLLPPSHSSSKDANSVLEQTDRAVDYVKELKEKIEKLKEKKANLTKLTGNKRSFHSNPSYVPSTSITTSTSNAPKLEIREITAAGGIEIALTSGLEHQFLFSHIVRIVCEEGLEVVNANLTVSGNSVLHMVYVEIKEKSAISGVGAVKVIERLEELINGSTNDQPDLDPLLWNFDFDNPMINLDF